MKNLMMMMMMNPASYYFECGGLLQVLLACFLFTRIKDHRGAEVKTLVNGLYDN